MCSSNDDFAVRTPKYQSDLPALKGQSHEKVYEFLTWNGSFSLN
jgi:hypothetical protein